MSAPPSVEEVAARLTGEYSRGSWSVPTDALNAFFRQAYAHGLAAGRAAEVSDSAALSQIAGLVGAVEGATPDEIAKCVAAALEENVEDSARLRGLTAIRLIAERGGEVVIGACDMLNPKCGYDAIARWPNGSRNGAELRGSSGVWEDGQDHAADPLEALARLSLLVVGP